MSYREYAACVVHSPVVVKSYLQNFFPHSSRSIYNRSVNKTILSLCPIIGRAYFLCVGHNRATVAAEYTRLITSLLYENWDHGVEQSEKHAVVYRESQHYLRATNVTGETFSAYFQNVFCRDIM